VERSRLEDRIPPDPKNLEQAEIAQLAEPAPDKGPSRLVEVAVGFFVVYLVWQMTRVGGAAHTVLIGDAFFIPADLLVVYTTVTAMRRCRTDRRRYRSWGFLAVAMIGYLIGHLFQVYQGGLRHLPDSPDAADALFYACFFVGLLGFAASRRNVVRRWLFTLDTVTIALSGGAMLWYFVAGPLATSEGHPVHVVVYAIVYPLGDLILLLAAVRTLQRGIPRSSQRAVQTIAAGILLYVVADTIVGYLNLHSTYHGGDGVDIVAMAATTLFAIAGALQPRVTSPETMPQAGRTGSSWISYAAAAAVFALVFVIERHDPFFPNLSITGVAVLIAMLVATRQLLGQRTLVAEQAKNDDLVGELQHQEFHDSLTGLANRALFNERLDHALARRRSLSVNHAVLMIELDGFKSVNDSFGRKAGDELLRTVALRLRGAVRRGDTVARVGGDEFAILLEDVSGENATVELVEHVLAVVREPVTIAGRRLLPELTIGVILTEEEPHTGDELLRYAEVAMHEAKQERHAHYCVFETAMQTALSQRVELDADLRGAVGRGELRVFYQPIVDLASQDIMGFEALVRWMHPSRGLLPPAAFLPIAEQCGLIHEIDTWVLYEASAEASRWQRESPQFSQTSVHVNLSPLQLHEPDLVDTIRAALSAAGLTPRMLTLELVESSVVNDLELAHARLTELKALGVRIALDDFGTGYSSLSHLRTLPIDELKIDKSFIAAMESSAQARILVHSLIQLGAALEMDTVAEGIEESEQLLHLREEKCLQGQGYLFSRPLDRSGLRSYLMAHADGSTDRSTKRDRLPAAASS
jgi:diguanylate cyclase (GGDEF)-like protein